MSCNAMLSKWLAASCVCPDGRRVTKFLEYFVQEREGQLKVSQGSDLCLRVSCFASEGVFETVCVVYSGAFFHWQPMLEVRTCFACRAGTHGVRPTLHAQVLLLLAQS